MPRHSTLRTLLIVASFVAFTLMAASSPVAACEAPCSGPPGAIFDGPCFNVCDPANGLLTYVNDMARGLCVPYC